MFIVVVESVFLFAIFYYYYYKKIHPFIGIQKVNSSAISQINTSCQLCLQADPQQSLPRRQLAEAALICRPHPPNGEGLDGGREHQKGLAERCRLLYLWWFHGQRRLPPGTAAHLQVRGRSRLSKPATDHFPVTHKHRNIFAYFL